MKIAHILHELKFSGAEIMYVDAAPFLQEKGCQLSVIATASQVGEYAPYFEKSGYKVIHMPYPSKWNIIGKIKNIIRLVILFKKEGFDVVHIHTNSIMWEMALCTWLASKQGIHTFHSVFTSRPYSYPIHILQRWGAKHIFGCKFQSISDTVYEHELKHYHNRTNKIYNWYGHNRFYPGLSGEKEEIREKLQIPLDALVLISVGGCSSIKRHSEIIKSLPYIIESKKTVVYFHLGSGEEEKAEKEIAKQSKVIKNIRFYGNQLNIREFLIASDIYLMTSKHEGISITTIEAMACEIPCILFDVPGLRDFNKTGENCLLIPENHKILAEKVIWLYSNPNIAMQLAKQAQDLVNDKYHLIKNVSELLKLYHS